MDIPEPMVELQIDKMVQDYASRIQSQGISLEQYMQFTGMTIDKLREQMREQAINNIKTRLVLEDIVKAEKIEVDEARRVCQDGRSIRYGSRKNKRALC